MKAIYLILFLLVFQISIVVASPLQIEPSSLSLNVTKGVEETIQVNITNPNNYSLYEIEAKGDVVVNPNKELIAILNPGNSTLVDVDIKINDIGDLAKTIRFESFERVNCSGQTTRDVNITLSGMIPRDFSMCTSDSIKYFNNYNTEVTIEINNFDTFESIAVGSSVVAGPFNTEGNYAHRVIPADMQTWGIITVSSDLGDVYDPENDGVLNLDIHSVLEETEVSLNFLKTNFTMSYNDEKQNMFSISNIGSKAAEDIHISGDWFIFDKNDVSIEPDDVLGINFKIVPSAFQLFDTSDTDKSYTKIITISGNNIPSVTQDIEIFIEYSEVEATNVSSYAWWQARKEYCDAYPDSSLCISEPRIVEVYVANDSIPVEFNMTGKTLKEYLDEVRGLKADWIEYSNNWKTDTDTMKLGITGNKNTSDKMLGLFEENEKKAKSFRSVFYLIFGTFMFIILGSMAAYVIYKYWLKGVLLREGTV